MASMDFIDQQIPPPKYWQQFEDLCLSLFRRVWHHPTAQKNGRAGQTQHGTDIWGEEDGLVVGIQCKGKDVNLGAALTEAELREEVEKAKKFVPPLARWYLATTAAKDAAIEEAARRITVEHRGAGLFSVQVLGWEDLQSLLFRHAEVIEEHYPNLAFSMRAMMARLRDELFDQTRAWEETWHEIGAAHQAQIDAGLFGSSCRLRDLFVDLRAWREDPLRSNRIVPRIAERLTDWAQRKDGAKFVFLQGGPGSGKSTIARILAARLAEQGRHCLFFPLQRISLDQPLPGALNDYLGRIAKPGRQPLDINGEIHRAPLMLIFDGLDELAKDGDVADDIARRFVQQIRNCTKGWELGGKPVKVLITGRVAIIQSVRSLIQWPHERWDLLPLFCDDEKIDEIFPDEPSGSPADQASSLPVPRYIEVAVPRYMEIMRQDQRPLWWQRYCIAVGRDFAGLPAVLFGRAFADLTPEPLLLYLIATTDYHLKFDPAKPISQAELYAALFEGVRDRLYAGDEPGARAEPAAAASLQRLFEPILGTMAVAAWHRDSRSADWRMTLQLSRPEIADAAARFHETRGLISLLVAFYFRIVGTDRSPTPTAYEFTHRSFAEYLTARHLLNELCEMTEADLLHWLRLAGVRPVTAEIADFMRGEAIRLVGERAAPCEVTALAVFRQLAWGGVPCRDCAATDVQSAADAVTTAAETCLIALSALGGRGHRPRLPTPNAQALARFLLRCKARQDEGLAFASLRNLDLSGHSFIRLSLQEADFRCSDLSNVNFAGADLSNGEFEGAVLTKVNFFEANISQAGFEDTDLSEADLGLAVTTNLYWQTDGDDLVLAGPVFDRAILRDANLADAALYGASFAGADLTRADFTGTKLQYANFEGATISGAKFKHAQLLGSNMAPDSLSAEFADGIDWEQKPPVAKPD
jgi:uncharacterized protein YjbI with pentapeptide repeats